MALPPYARAWLAQRQSGIAAVAAIEGRELRALDTVRALAQSDALLSAAPIAVMTESRRDSSGFVEQQRLFRRARR
jgi:hypothetical protein